MAPWFWCWAPHYHFPFSGSVAQEIEPNTTWFADLIHPGSGNARVERRAFDKASYGTQLEWITEMLLDAARDHPPTSPKAQQAQACLTQLKAEIAQIKAAEHEAAAERLAAHVQALRARGGPAYAAFVARVGPLAE
jgi:hypothetical protein